MGYELKVFTNYGKEIDFLASKNNKTFTYIQVAYNVADEKAYKREMSAFDKLDNRNQKKILIINDTINYSISVVKHTKLKFSY